MRFFRRPDARMGFGLWVLLISVNAGRNSSVDAGARVQIAHAIWSQGRISVEPSAAMGSSLVPTSDRSRRTSYFGLGQTLLFVPFDFLGTKLSRLVKTSE